MRGNAQGLLLTLVGILGMSATVYAQADEDTVTGGGCGQTVHAVWSQ